MSADPSAIDLSIVVATFDRSALLGETLRSLVDLELPPSVRVEVIVCDDGSRDDTFAVVREYEARIALRYCYQPDAGFRVAAARNMGLRLSRGRIILFLDSGVIAAPQCAREHLVMHACGDRRSFVIGPTLAYRSDDAGHPSWRTTALGSWVDRARRGDIPADPRMAVWESVGYQLDRLSAPWSTGWGNNVSMPRASLLMVDGFDETFEGWGGEDVDASYALFRQGLSFVVNPNAMTLHLPHPTAGKAIPPSNYHNKKRIFAKSPCLETELLSVFGTTRYSKLLDDVRGVARRALVPNYATWTAPELHAWLAGQCRGPVGVVGAGTGELCELVGSTWACDPDGGWIERLRSRSPGMRCEQLVGVTTSMKEATFGTVILTDAWRAWQPRVVRELLKEARRIADRTLLLFSPKHTVPHVPESPEWDLRELQSLAAGAELVIAPLRDAQSEPTAVFEVRPSSAHP